MALSFTGAYITADGERWRLVHVTLGYTLAGLLVARVLWGCSAPRQVRLSVLWRKLQGLPAWLQSLVAVRSPSALQAAWRPAKPADGTGRGADFGVHRPAHPQRLRRVG